MAFAKSVCVSKCPSSADVCSWEAHQNGTNVCDKGNQFRCPYYASQTMRVQSRGHYDLYYDLPTLTGTDSIPAAAQTVYFDELASTNQSACNVQEASTIDMLSNLWDSVQSLSRDSEQARCGEFYQYMSKIPSKGPCYPVFSNSVDYLNRCIPDSSSLIEAVFKQRDENSTVAKALDEPVAVLQRYASDLNKGVYIVLVCGLASGCFLSIVWMVILRYFAGVMAWFAVILINIIFAFGCFLCFQKAGLLGQAGVVGEVSPCLFSCVSSGRPFRCQHVTTACRRPDPCRAVQYIAIAWEAANMPEGFDPVTKDKKVWEIVAWISLVLFALLLLFTLIMIRRIKIAVACLKVR